MLFYALNTMKTLTKFIAVCALLAGANAVLAHTTESHASTDHSTHNAAPAQKDWGIAGNAQAVTRSIDLRMTDDMRFAPNQFTVKLGETVRIRVVNAGQIMHEIVLGTASTLDTHASAMLQQPGMAHSEAFMAHVPPQQNGELIWTFNRPGTFDFACLIAGHYQAGMRGTFTVTP